MTVDHYHRIRESCGDAVVKPLLKAVARVIDEHIRTSDFVARCRDDAFAVILTETRLDEAEGFRRRLLQTAHDHSTLDVKLRISVHAVEAKPDETVAELLARAEVTASDGARRVDAHSQRTPLGPAVLLGDKLRRAVLGPRGAGLAGVERIDQRLPDRLRPQRQVRHEALVRPAVAIVGHARRHRQATLDQRQRKIVEQRAVIKKMIRGGSGRCCPKTSARRSPDRSCPGTRRPARTAPARRPTSPAPSDGPGREPATAAAADN